MDKIIKADLPLRREEVSRGEARLVLIFLLLYFDSEFDNLEKEFLN